MADILVVDDEIGIRELLSEILGDEGHEVLQAENAAQARSARQKARPDLVLLDIWMPDTDGIAVLREWSESGLLDMPVIMMSGHATVEMASQATRLGAVGFLEKPIALQKLLAAVQNALQGKSAMLSPIRSQQTASIQAGQTAVPASPRAELKSEPFAFNAPTVSRKRALAKQRPATPKASYSSPALNKACKARCLGRKRVAT